MTGDNAQLGKQSGNTLTVEEGEVKNQDGTGPLKDSKNCRKEAAQRQAYGSGYAHPQYRGYDETVLSYGHFPVHGPSQGQDIDPMSHME